MPGFLLQFMLPVRDGMELKMKKRFKYPIIAIAVCALLLTIFVPIAGDKKAGIEGNRVDFGYPLFAARLLMGEPDEESVNTEFPDEWWSYYDREFFDHPASIAYCGGYFIVYRIDLKISVSEDEARELFDRVSQSIQNEYKDGDDYYCTPVTQDEDGTLRQKIRISIGAGGKSFEISYQDGELRAYGDYLY